MKVIILVAVVAALVTWFIVSEWLRSRRMRHVSQSWDAANNHHRLP